MWFLIDTNMYTHVRIWNGDNQLIQKGWDQVYRPCTHICDWRSAYLPDNRFCPNLCDTKTHRKANLNRLVSFKFVAIERHNVLLGKEWLQFWAALWEIQEEDFVSVRTWQHLYHKRRTPRNEVSDKLFLLLISFISAVYTGSQWKNLYLCKGLPSAITFQGISGHLDKEAWIHWPAITDEHFTQIRHHMAELMCQCWSQISAAKYVAISTWTGSVFRPRLFAKALFNIYTCMYVGLFVHCCQSKWLFFHISQLFCCYCFCCLVRVRLFFLFFVFVLFFFFFLKIVRQHHSFSPMETERELSFS